MPQHEKPDDESLGGVRSVIDALYRDFLLRDLFAKVVPGCLVLVPLVGGLDLAGLMASGTLSVSWPVAILGAGASWLAGFAVQTAGELLHLIRHHPHEFDDDRKRYGLRVKFGRDATASEKRRAERYALIKEAAGNGGSAILFACVLSGLRISLAKTPAWNRTDIVFWVGGLLLAAALLRTNRTHLKKQYSYMQRVTES